MRVRNRGMIGRRDKKKTEEVKGNKKKQTKGEVRERARDRVRKRKEW